jgi:acetylornithine deacetylase/succinyl-diaminopimelate desuccinylase-like protein
MQVQTTLDFARRHRGRFLDELVEFISFPSISAAPKHTEDVVRCAAWLGANLRGAGLAGVRIVPTQRHPVVYGEWFGAPGRPTLLIYGHYDVQPVDPIAAWRIGPFEPAIKGKNLYGRGASDDKGQLFTHVKAIESYLHGIGRLPINVQCVFEGEDEIGSPNLAPVIESGELELAPDAIVISDLAMISLRKPAITYSTRGNLSLELEVIGPDRDLHSGVFGGIVHDPLQALCEIIARLHDRNHRIAIPGVYDRVRKSSGTERRRMERFGPSDEALLEDAKAEQGWGERGFSAYQRETARPALTINGLSGGYAGPGLKMVIPSRALAKLSFRLVSDQDPSEIDQLFRDYVARISPPTVRSVVRTIARAAPACINPNNSVIRAAALALRKGFGAPASLVRSGGTIPVVSLFQRNFGVPIALMGFGQRDDRMHAPNEKFHLPTFFRAIEASIWFMSILGDSGGVRNAAALKSGWKNEALELAKLAQVQ